MPTKPKAKKDEQIQVEVGTVSEEIEVPVASEVIFRKIWRIQHFPKTITRRNLLDSPKFQCSVNGMTTFWNVSVRFWKGSNGKKVTNPVVVCLNLIGCHVEETSQVRIRFQFGIWDASIKHWECCPISSVVLNLQNSQDLLSIGYKSMGILERHLDNNKDIAIMLKLQIIQSDEEVHSLSQDMARLLTKDTIDKDTIIECFCKDNNDNNKSKLYVHSWIIRTRSEKLWLRIQDYHDEQLTNIKYKLDLIDFDYTLIMEFIRYIYTDKVDNADMHAYKLLPLSVRYQLKGLTVLCERTLLESLTPNNVANILLLADQCGCEQLRKAALHYCENSNEIKESVHVGRKTLAWRVMEMVNPDLFMEACESFGSSSSTMDSTGTRGSLSD